MIEKAQLEILSGGEGFLCFMYFFIILEHFSKGNIFRYNQLHKKGFQF